jgi:hypothetical protein
LLLLLTLAPALLSSFTPIAPFAFDPFSPGRFERLEGVNRLRRGTFSEGHQQQ